MATVQNVIDSLELHVRDPSNTQVTVAQWIIFINDAVYDAENAGVLIPLEDDESITLVTNTYEYNVPASFAYVEELRIENTSSSPSTWDEFIPRGHWEIRIDGGVAKFYITQGAAVPDGTRLKVVGQKRPSAYTVVGDTVDRGLVPFFRERAKSYALKYMSAGSGELDQSRLQLSEIAMRDSEEILKRSPAEFRVRPSAEYVQGR